jgi:hypothetical protein
MDDKEFAELYLRVTIVPEQASWPASKSLHWQRLNEATNEPRERVSKAYIQMDEIDGNADLRPENKQQQRNEVAAHAFAEFENSKTLRRAREAVRHDASPEMLKALEQAEAGWERAMNKIASVPVGRVLFRRDTRVDT